ncbi:hypothetical protein E2I00_016801 [Balaenoptera physalus]|uniref:Nociceptin receptor n=1 Tax=Balaenoptera physalus TaxID=9770 RepID=A0A6A1QAX4_BALPH|nr:hypothetical protein E2I00_016801 [Balaenoptera physalus]
MESLFPAPFWEVLYGGHLQGNLSLLSPNHSLLPPHLLLNASHGAFLPLGLKVTIVGLYLAVCIGGLLGNCLVMYVILRHTKMKTATNIYIFNLALADTLVLLTLPFQGTDVLLGFWPFGNALCKAVIAIDYYNMFTSTFTLTAMSVDRYVAICHPIRALDVRTSSKAQAVNVAIWALASVVGVPVAIMGSAQVEDEEIECLVEIPAPQDYWGPVFAVCIFLFSFIIPVLIISVCYSLMVRRLRGVRLLSGSREKDRNLRRITRLVLVVVAVFVGCWTPVQVFVLVQGLGVQPGSETAVAILRFCTALGYVSDRVRSVAKDVAVARKTAEMAWTCPWCLSARRAHPRPTRSSPRHTNMKTATNIYIFNVALADTSVLLTLPFQGTDVLLGVWPFGNALCKTVSGS